MKTKRDNFVNAAHRLAEAVTDYQNIRNDTVRDGMIQRFEFTFELGWKALKEYMLDAGMQNTLQFPKQVLREAYAAELIDDEGVWLDMLEYPQTRLRRISTMTILLPLLSQQKNPETPICPSCKKLAARWEK